MSGLRPISLCLVTLLVLGLGGCESAPEGRPDSSSANRSGASSRPAYETRRMGSVGTGADFSVAERATIREAWNAYVDRRPDWPELRERWKALGPAATDALVDNLLRAMVLAWLANYPDEAERARRELILLGDTPVPTVTGVLADPTFPDPETGKATRLSTDIVTELVGLLLIAEAEPQLLDRARSDVPSVRRACYEALGRLGSPRGVALVVSALGRSRDWIDRVAAAKALAYSGTDEGRAALIRALRDEEDLVATEAARSLAVRRDATALSALDARREEARAAGNHRLAAAMGAAAKSIREAP